ncbi:VWA domain-containing protein [uncultured Subdoligranulum sp.]|uniref:DUF7604 domain-containing protein n=1 Tax=uncultured Subdoligranulum sp. TaxID=512298 RepID=UPI003207D405
MKKRVLSALLVLCMACSLVSTALATDGQATPETANEPAATSRSVGEMATPETSKEEGSSADPSAYPARTAEAKVEGTDASVQVDIPAGSLPEDATLTAALIGSSTDNAEAVADVAAELDEAQVDYDGFVALDISFKDAEGNEVEPRQPVSVSFTLPAALLPADADPATLEVQHLEENEAGEVTDVVPVADAADETEGTVTVEAPVATLSAAPAPEADETAAMPENAEVTAEFTVDGFSSFVITWNENNQHLHGNSHSVSFSIVDTDGNELSVPSTYDLTYDLPDSGAITFDEMVNANQIRDITIGTEQYTFRNATFVLNGTERHPIVSAERIQNADILEDGIRFYDSVFPGETGYYTRTEGAGDFRLELVYERKEDSEIDVYEPDPVYTKTAVTNDGGKTYDLALTVSGDVGESSQKVKLDVLFIVDQSGSMGDRAWVNSELKTYQKIASDAAGELARGLASNENIDARFAVVTFSDSIADTNYYDDAILRQNWTRDAQSVITATDVRSDGGTNYEAGMMAGRAAMLEARPDAMKYVIFLSDGEPTYHYTENGNSTGGGDHTAAGDDTAAYEQAASYNEVNGFFTVGVGLGGASADSYLKLLRGAVEDSVEATVGTAVDSDNFSGYTAEDPSELTARFTEIQAQITNLSMKNVKITDTLSDFVEPVDGAKPYVVIKDSDGNQVTTEDGQYEITGNDASTTPVSFAVEFNGTDGNYELKQGYTYELHLKVQPTDKAYETFATTDYTDKGAANTGTYAEKDGFFSNVSGSAKLTYDTDISKDHSEDYPMPVIQVPSTSLTINKTMEDLPKDQWDTAADNITFTVKDGDTSVANINLGTTPPDGANYTIQKTETGYTVVVNGLTVTKEYTVTETCGKLEGYNVTSTLAAAGQQIKMDKDAAQNKLDVTNTYTPDNQTLTITKTVGGEMGSYTDDFTFTLTLEKAGGPYTTPLTIEEGTTAKDANGNLYTGTLTAKGGTYTFVLSNDEQMVLSVPYGYKVTVTEQQENNGYTVSSQYYETGSAGKVLTPGAATQTVDSIDKDYTVEFANNRNPVAPTGLESNHTAPYTLMITAAGIAGLALIGSMMARRVRRRREE